MFFFNEISKLYAQTFYPEQIPFQGFVATQGEEKNGIVAVQLTRETDLLPWPFKIIDYAFRFFAWLRGIKHPLPTHLPAEYFREKKVGEPIDFSWKNRQFKVHLTAANISAAMIERMANPFRRNLYILTNTGNFGWLGTDKTYELKKYLKLSDDSAYPGNEKDILCKVQTLDFPTRLPAYLPLSIFEGKKEGERIFFFYKDRPIELTLTQLKHPLEDGQVPFETFLDNLKTKFNMKSDYLFLRDIPEGPHTKDNYLFLRDIPETTHMIADRSLSKEAQVWSSKRNQFIPVTLEKIKFFKHFFDNSEQPSLIKITENSERPNSLDDEKKVFSYVYKWQGMKSKEDLKILIDRQRILIAGIPTRSLELRKKKIKFVEEHKGSIIQLSPIINYALDIRFYPDSKVDLSKTTFEVKQDQLVLKFSKA